MLAPLNLDTGLSMERNEPKPPPKWIQRSDRPRDSFELNGRTYRIEKAFKRDFYAVTGRYVGPDGERVVLKRYNKSSWFLIPLGWLGRWMARREIRHHMLLEDLPEVPRLLGDVGRSGLVHEWMEGSNLLERGWTVPDDFFDRLEDLMRTLHDKGMVYVDSNKADNILITSDGRPGLVDFQISWAPETRGLFGWIKRRLFDVFRREDLYHVKKLKRRYRSDLMTREDVEKTYRRKWTTRLHRVVFAPLRNLKRRIIEGPGGGRRLR